MRIGHASHEVWCGGAGFNQCRSPSLPPPGVAPRCVISSPKCPSALVPPVWAGTVPASALQRNSHKSLLCRLGMPSSNFIFTVTFSTWLPNSQVSFRAVSKHIRWETGEGLKKEPLGKGCLQVSLGNDKLSSLFSVARRLGAFVLVLRAVEPGMQAVQPTA